MATFEKIRELLAEQLTIAPAKITPESQIVRDLGADSLDMVEMLMGLEDEFGVSVDEEKAKTLVTVQDVVDLIDKK